MGTTWHGAAYRLQSMPGRRKSGPAGQRLHQRQRESWGPVKPLLTLLCCLCRALLHVAACARLCRTQGPLECTRATRGLAELEQREGTWSREEVQGHLRPHRQDVCMEETCSSFVCSEHLGLEATGWHPELQAPGTGSPGLCVQMCMQSPFPTPSTPTTQEPGPKESPSSHMHRVTVTYMHLRTYACGRGMHV